MSTSSAWRDQRVARHPDVVVDADEARVAGVKQVEVRE